jgi:O-antigen chain-terminating methyltransferase
LPDLTPLARARDAAAGKTAAIGSVNPRRGGLVNTSIQLVKRSVARGLHWFVRDQVVFNRQLIACIETCIETLADVNRTIYNLVGQTNAEVQRLRTEDEGFRSQAQELRTKAADLQDLASHWARWREQWQLKLHRNEVEFLKSVADLNASVHQKIMHIETNRVSEIAEIRRTLEASFRSTAAELEASFTQRVWAIEHDVAVSLETQHGAFEQLANSNATAVERSVTDQIRALDQRLIRQAQEFEKSLATSLNGLEKKFYTDLEHIRSEYERLIYTELRIVRQRLAVGAAPLVNASPAAPQQESPFDYARFSERFRGAEQYVIDSQRFYVPFFAGRRRVLDIGCGRGEFLRLMRESAIPATGVEASEESAAYCRTLGLDALHADLFAFLLEKPQGSYDGIFCSQVVEHLPPSRLPDLVRLCASRLATGGILVIETPNPECLAIFGTHFYLDPTHTRPVPSQLLMFYMEEFGMGRIEVHPRALAIETMPEVGTLPPAFRGKFFGGLDYAIIGYKL